MMKRLWIVLCACSAPQNTASNQPAAFVQSDTQNPATIMPADLSCLGSFKDPAGPTATTAVDMVVQDFEKKTPVMGAMVEAYASQPDFNAGKVSASGGPSGADGKVTLMMPAGSYRVIFRTTADPIKTIETVEFNRAWNDPIRDSVSVATKGEIPGLVSVIPDDTKGVVAGDVRDCNNQRIGGAQFSVTSMTGGPFDSAANTFYFVDIDAKTTVPERSQKWTSGDGVFASLNVPPGISMVTATGLLKMGGAPTSFGTGLVTVRSNSISVVQLSPRGM
jgi:hypothetical protein